jgi:hypothetical protein
MAHAVKWTGPTARTTSISSSSMNQGANVLSGEIDNETNLDRFATFKLSFNCATAPTAGYCVELYILYDVTGSEYEDGDATPTDPTKAPAAIFAARAVTGEQIIVQALVPIAPFAFKLLLKSELDQDATAVELLCETHNEEIQ